MMYQPYLHDNKEALDEHPTRTLGIIHVQIRHLDRAHRCFWQPCTAHHVTNNNPTFGARHQMCHVTSPGRRDERKQAKAGRWAADAYPGELLPPPPGHLLS